MCTPSNRKRKRVLIAGIETIRHKNLYQFESLDKCGYDFTILTIDMLGDSADMVAQSPNVHLIKTQYGYKGLLYLWSLFKILLTCRFSLAENYAGTLAYLLGTALIRLFGIPVVTIARGEENNYLKGNMGNLEALVFKYTYKLSGHAIYKAPYMEEFLDLARIPKRNRLFLTNAVELPEKAQKQNTAGCTFLFLNTIKRTRYPDTPLKAFLNICQKRNLGKDSQYRFRAVGFRGDKAPNGVRELENRTMDIMEGVQDAPVELLPWDTTPEKHLANADIFLLPSELVYLNYGLLEAMGLGLVPLIQDTIDSELVIKDKVEGYILPDIVAEWEQVMERLMDDVTLRTAIGVAARQRVASEFSLDTYRERYCAFYDRITN